jgi:hypothetical protein
LIPNGLPLPASCQEITLSVRIQFPAFIYTLIALQFCSDILIHTTETRMHTNSDLFTESQLSEILFVEYLSILNRGNKSKCSCKIPCHNTSKFVTIKSMYHRASNSELYIHEEGSWTESLSELRLTLIFSALPHCLKSSFGTVF